MNGLKKRIIPCLDIQNGRTVSGTHFKNLRDCGDPVELGKFYAEAGADELVFLDISAGSEKRKTMTELVRKIGKELFIPFTVGGGISSLEDIQNCLQNGADKVSVSTIAAQNPDFIRNAADTFGSQAIVVSIDVKNVLIDDCRSMYKVFIKGGREETEYEAVAFAQLMEQKGAGEILLNSIDRDGTEGGYDLEILNDICNAVQIPVIASSGAGSVNDLHDAFSKTSCSAALASCIFHFGKYSIAEAKEFLETKGIPMRKR